MFDHNIIRGSKYSKCLLWDLIHIETGIQVLCGITLLLHVLAVIGFFHRLSKENAVCKNCQQSKDQQKNEEKETQLVQKSVDENSNVENAISTPSRSKPIPLPRRTFIKLGNNLPPSLTTTTKFFDHTSSLSKFSTSNSMMLVDNL
uniref:Uncharacterized protein n=1 Tax=Panagrolaimus sp. PS1159 TaxID=55785 RepID=A0AC35GLB8_9BILA